MRLKKLIARVRPGVEETLAWREPRSALIRLDLPTLERPRKANSGADGGGKCAGAVAERRNLGKTCMGRFQYRVWGAAAPRGWWIPVSLER